MRLLAYASLFALTMVSSADAEEATVYESLSGLSIGTVFYTQAERDLLDARRRQPSIAVTPPARDTIATVKARPRDKPAAGYIISSSGQSRVYEHGDFVPGSKTQVDALAFPGNVTVTRHEELSYAAERLSDGGKPTPEPGDGDAHSATGEGRADAE